MKCSFQIALCQLWLPHCQHSLVCLRLCWGVSVIFPKKEPGALLLTDLQVTRSLTVTVPSLADAMSPAPMGGHTSHLAFPSTVRE